MYLNNSYKFLSLSSGSVVKMRSAPSKCHDYCHKKICYWKFCFQDTFMISEARDFENLFLFSLKGELQEPLSVGFLFSHNLIGCSTVSRTEMNKRVAVLVLVYRLKLVWAVRWKIITVGSFEFFSFFFSSVFVMEVSYLSNMVTRYSKLTK